MVETKTVYVYYTNANGKLSGTFVLATVLDDCLAVAKQPIDDFSCFERRWCVYDVLSGLQINENPFNKKSSAMAFAKAVLDIVPFDLVLRGENDVPILDNSQRGMIRIAEQAAHKN
ncbi:MAG: hypothetical protein QXS68_02995 [Candidatus Methanomethylicaceae archaeon]